MGFVSFSDFGFWLRCNFECSKQQKQPEAIWVFELPCPRILSRWYTYCCFILNCYSNGLVDFILLLIVKLVTFSLI